MGDPTLEAYGDFVRLSKARELRALRNNKSAKWLWHVIDQIRPEIKCRKRRLINDQELEYQTDEFRKRYVQSEFW